MTTKLNVCLMPLLLLSGFLSAQAQMVSVTPAEYTDAMTNPLMGFRDRVTNADKDYPYVTLVRDYVDYNVLENSASDGVEKIIDYTKATYLDFEKHNVKVIPRVILIWDETTQCWPSDLPYDWTTDELKARLLAFVAKLGVAWNNDTRIAFIETGLIGKWGEQESPVGIDEPVVGSSSETWAEILGPAFTEAFPNKKCMVRGMEKWADDFEAGVYWDSYGAWSKMNGPTDNYPEILRYNNPPYERYKKAPMQGEIAYSMSDPSQIGNNENETVQNADFRGWFIDNLRSTHSTTCGLEYDHENSANDYGANIIQKVFGYRFLIKTFEFAPRTQPGGTIDISARILNDGSAPIYESWPLAFVLIDETTREIVWKSVIPSADITTWYPGANYDWTPEAPPGLGTGTREYLAPAVENVITASIQIPADFAAGQYLAGLSILDPTTELPGVFFSVQNFFQKSNTQPLCRIGIGIDASSYTLNSSIFDAYDWKNDTRSYSLTPNPTGTAFTERISDNSARAKPNLASNTLSIDHAGNSFISIFNAQGKLLYKKKSLGVKTTIDAAKLRTAGFVFVHIASFNHSSIFKVSVLK